MNNYILEYYQKICDGSVVVGKWVRMAYEHLVHGLEDGLFCFDQKKANKAIKFIETFCHHCEGRNDLLKLELWQKAAVSAIFGIVDEDGTRHFREVVIIVARKNGKSLFAAAVANYALFVDGEYGARIFCVAPKLDQANIIYSAIWQTVASEPELKERIKRRKSDYYVESTNSSVQKIAFNAKKSDGFNPSFTVCDEIASWPGVNGLKQYEVMKSALGARKQPIILSISTSGYENDGIYDELIKRSTRFLMGDSKEKRLLPLLYMIDDTDKWNDINELRKSNPNLGVSVSTDYMLEEIAVAEGSFSKRAEFLTKYCCIKQNSSQAWFSAQDVAKACGPEITPEFLAHSYCVGGIDLSQTTDLTAACVVVEKDGLLYVLAHFWLPEGKISDAIVRDNVPYNAYIHRGLLSLSGDNYVDYHDCYNWFVRLVEDYEILPLQVGYDKYCAQYLVQEMQSYGFHMNDVNQSWNLTPVLKEMDGMMRDGVIRIGDNDLLKMHLLDSAIKRDELMSRERLVKINPSCHIDGTAALSDAICVRQKWYSEIGGQLSNG